MLNNRTNSLLLEHSGAFRATPGEYGLLLQEPAYRRLPRIERRLELSE